MNSYEKATEIFNLSRSGTEKSVIFLSPEQIQLFPQAKRTRGGDNLRIRMAESVRKYGVLQPFSVRIWQSNSGFSCYQLVGEEERFRAVCMAGITRIPCFILSSDDKRCAALALIDEYSRKNLHFLDEARLFMRLMRDYSMKQAEIAEKCGLSQSSVANKLRLLQLSEGEQESIRRAGLGERHARCLLRIDDQNIRQKALETVILRHLSVVQTEDLIENMTNGASAVSRQKDAVLSNATKLPESRANEATYSPSDMNMQALTEKRTGRFPVYSSPAQIVPAVKATERTFRNTEAEIQAKSGTFSEKTPAVPASETAASRRITAEIPAPGGIMPRRFILHDLQPLYNSIEKTLSIFRKTGMNAECTREEAADAVHIYIRIPRKAEV